MWHTEDRSWVLFDPEFVGDVLDPPRASALWAGHRWFAYDLVRWGRPELVVELGTQYGPSFFTFCQAVRDEGLDTSLHAIDTWEGDSFTGAYGGEVHGTVERVVTEAFPTVDAQLHRCLFRDALGEFADDSIDLLHIDGNHDYDDVKDDYQSWLPKLAPGGVVLFHDVDPTSDMGSARFWEELSVEEPSITFTHSLGLGVLFPKGTKGFDFLFGSEFERWRDYYPSRAGDFLGMLRYRDQTRMIEERDTLIADYESRLVHQEHAIERLTAYARWLEDQLNHPVMKVANRARQIVGGTPPPPGVGPTDGADEGGT